jgi:hypothetical protein
MSGGMNIAFVVVAVVLIVAGLVLTWRERRTMKRRR